MVTKRPNMENLCHKLIKGSPIYRDRRHNTVLAPPARECDWRLTGGGVNHGCATLILSPGNGKKHPVLRLPQRTVDSTAVTAHHLSYGTGSHEMARIGGYSTRTLQGTLRERGALMKKWSVFIACLWAFQVSAQSTYPAAGCSQAQIQAAITAEQAAAADGDIISIPAGNCTWTGSQQINATFNNSVTIQGAGAVSATTGGASTTGADQTVILNNLTGASGVMFQFNTYRREVLPIHWNCPHGR